MKKRKRFSATLMGVVVVGLSAYVGYPRMMRMQEWMKVICCLPT